MQKLTEVDESLSIVALCERFVAHRPVSFVDRDGVRILEM